MEANPPSEPSAEATAVFERDLSELIRAAFGHGAAIEDTWEITSSVSDAPNWRVTVEKMPADEVTYEPEFLEE